MDSQHLNTSHGPAAGPILCKHSTKAQPRRSKSQRCWGYSIRRQMLKPLLKTLKSVGLDNLHIMDT